MFKLNIKTHFLVKLLAVVVLLTSASIIVYAQTAPASVETGFRIYKNTGSSGTTINAHTICKVVKNSSSVKDYFAPTKTSGEWNMFIANATSLGDISFGECIQCSSGDCCDLATGNFKTDGTICRASAGPCDIAETCSGVSSVCPTETYRSNTYVCDTCTPDASSGACQINDTGYKCSGTSAICGTTNPYTCPQNAPVNNNVWNSSSWATASVSNNCNLGPYTCSGNNIVRTYFGCNTSGSCNTTAAGTYTTTSCTGGENSRCVAGQSTCQDLCSDGVDNDGDGPKDNLDKDCNSYACEECNPADPCCDINGCFTTGNVCRGSAGVCDVVETCTGTSGACPSDSFRSNAYVCDTCVPSGPSGDCQLNDTGYKCSGTTATCGTSNPYTCPQNAPVNNNVWTSSTWASASSSNYCNLGSYFCDGNTIKRSYYGCNTSGSCNTTTAGSYSVMTCGGGENSRCVNGQSSCQDLCTDGFDNDNDGLTDGADPDCGCGQCNPSEACCSTSGCFLAAGTGVGTCQKCTGSSGIPVNQTSSEDILNQCSTGAQGTTTSCRSNNCSGTGAYCGYLPISQSCRNPVGPCDKIEMCTGSSYTCPTNAYQTSSYVCATLSSCSGANNSCSPSQSVQYCNGTHSDCVGTTGSINCEASSYPKVWYSAWQNFSSTYRCGTTTPHTCNGQQPQGYAKGCNAWGSCGYTSSTLVNVGSSCAGTEKSWCSVVGGVAACRDLCTDGEDNNGDGYADNLDASCNPNACEECTSGTCCDSDGCFKDTNSVCYTASCTASTTYLSGSDNACTYSYSNRKCSGGSASCTGTLAPSGATCNCPSGKLWDASLKQCVNVSASKYCGLSSSYCYNNDVYKYALSCNGSGTCNNQSTYQVLAQDCTNTCSNGSCVTCTSSSDCPADYLSGPYSCSGNSVKGYWNDYYCTASGSCAISASQVTVRTCGGGENSRCRSGYSTCYNYCSDGLDNDGDYYTDSADTDCCGCGTYCKSYPPFCGDFQMRHTTGCISRCYYSGYTGQYLTADSSYNCSNGIGLHLNSCPTGSYGVNDTCRVCPIGSYTDMVAQTSCSQCPAGYWCSNGEKKPCPSGTTSYSGAKYCSDCFATGT